MIRRVFALALVLSMLFCSVALADGGEKRIYRKLAAMEEKYPEGSSWTTDRSYRWSGGVYTVAYGCAGFSFMMSDAAFGDLPARQVRSFRYDDLQVGDVVYLSCGHTVILLEVGDEGVTVAEGSYNGVVHWGRELTRSEIMKSDWMMTRYPVAGAKAL